MKKILFTVFLILLGLSAHNYYKNHYLFPLYKAAEDYQPVADRLCGEISEKYLNDNTVKLDDELLKELFSVKSNKKSAISGRVSLEADCPDTVLFIFSDANLNSVYNKVKNRCNDMKLIYKSAGNSALEKIENAVIKQTDCCVVFVVAARNGTDPKDEAAEINNYLNENLLKQRMG